MPDVDFENLNGEQFGALVEAIKASFDQGQLTMMLRIRLAKNLDDLAEPGIWSYRVFQVVDASQKQGFGGRLIEAIERERPDTPRIAGLRTTLGLVVTKPSNAPVGLASSSLEKIVRERSTMRDFGAWLDGLVKIQRRVCRVEGKNYGTGFLVGDDLLLTNYHVVEPEVTGVALPSELGFRFDYSTANGADRQGVVVRAAKNWLVTSASYSAADLKINAGVPAASELDFALIRLAEPIGAESASNAARNFIPMSPKAPTVKEGDVVFIVQHPQGGPLALASGVVEKPVPGGLRIRYDANTEAGSSGSPVFDASLNLVSLHHAGDPNWQPSYNQGIPIGLIAAAVAPS